ncbi:unnamed protein product [Candida verbasci]|uniref:Major facilitator superfamily (MFS) profile domain-containing protein n=1 Tax=Candida verbasci TaxID=1227364 RepID=A0A9W4X8B5_9ASCO|nr:unnamed protein product [Candida verbasci]
MSFEKDQDVIKDQSSSVSIRNIEQYDISDYDNALAYLKNQDQNENIRADVKRITKKLDMIILPILCGIYLLQFLDKSLLNYSAAMGIKTNLKNNEFANLSTIFYASYIFGEPFISYCLQKFPIGRTLGVFIILWGIVISCHSACKTYASLMVVRTLLGIFESSSTVGIIIISGMYYSKPQQVSRMGIWALNAGTATIIGSLLSFGFQHIQNSQFQSWQILFLAMGVITIVYGIFVIFYLPNNIESVWFLKPNEKIYLLQNVIKPNQTGTINYKFKKEQILELFSDKFTWLYLLLCICSQIVTGSIGTFSVTITLTFGFDSYQSALLQIPIGVLIIIIIIASTQLVFYVKNITYVMMSMFIPTIIGAIVLIISPSKIGNLLSLYLLYSGSCSITLIYYWISCNTAGSSKKFFRSGLIMIGFSISCIIGPQLFQSYSAPNYIIAKIVILITQVLCVPLTYILGYLLKRENETRDKLKNEGHGEHELKENFEWMDLTDIENKNFRYFY